MPTIIDPKIVVTLVENALGDTGWTVSRPVDGWGGTTFVASLEEDRVFVKFKVAIPILQRLAALEVVPPILYAGNVDSLAYVIQEFTDAPYPEWDWFAGHLPELALLLRTYQQDDAMHALLSARNLTRFADDLNWAEQCYRILREAFACLQEPNSAYAQFLSQLAEAQTSLAVPTHGDASRKNLLLAPDRIYLIDWDEVSLSDPMRDIGPLLWWYVPPARWVEFFQRYAAPLGYAVTERVYWWSARASLEVAHGLLERGYHDRARDFLEDFIAAVRREANPHARYTIG